MLEFAATGVYLTVRVGDLDHQQNAIRGDHQHGHQPHHSRFGQCRRDTDGEAERQRDAQHRKHCAFGEANERQHKEHGERESVPVEDRIPLSIFNGHFNPLQQRAQLSFVGLC